MLLPRLALGNFLIAFAAGSVLANGLTLVQQIPGLSADSVLAYLLGSLIAFGLLLKVRAKGAAVLWKLVTGALLAAVVLLFLVRGGISGPLVYPFFFLLCVFFALTFASRSLRSDAAARLPRGLPIVETSHSAGYVSGLFVMNALGMTGIGDALLVAAALLGVLALAELGLKSPEEKKAAEDDPAAKPLDARQLALSVRFIAMTIGIQVVTQRASSLSGKTLPLAAFEVGVTVAPLACSVLGVALVARSVRLGSYAVNVLIPVTAMFLLCLAGVTATWKPVTFLGFGVSAFLYELVAIAILQKLGEVPGRVATTFAITGVVCSAAYFALLRFDSWPVVLGTCLVAFGVALASHRGD